MNVQPRSLQIRGWLNALEIELQQETDVEVRVRTEDAVRIAGLSERHKVACRENIYLYFIALPIIFRTARQFFGLTNDQAIKALGGEYYRKFGEFLGHNPYRAAGHPLPKSKKDYLEIFSKWTESATATTIYQSYPDLTLRPPAPASVVFDVKYFTGGDPKRALVHGVQELTYYRGLPSGSEGGSLYDFGCLLAFDASPDHQLQSTWNSIGNKEIFWRGGNIMPLIISGRPTLSRAVP